MPQIAALSLMVLLPWMAATGSEGNLRAVIDWSRWDAMLRAHVVDGQVDYDAIAADPDFAVIVTDIADADLEGSTHDAVVAFYINAYNVLAVQGILNGSSPKSGFGKLRFFFRDRYTVAGETFSLHSLEKQRIRTLGNPRIHFAIVCASSSCPPLRSEVYIPLRLDEQLDDNARRFINDPVKNRFDTVSGKAQVSKVFKWFPEDFETVAGSVQDYIARYVEDDQVARTLRGGRFKLRYLEYDWSLNGTFSTTKR